MPKNTKGDAGEREVAKLIANWWPEKQLSDGRAVLFVRTPKSGGWAYGAEFNVKGDLTTNAERFPFCIEVKRRENWTLQRFVEGRPSPVWTWWRQCQRDARAVELEPMMWFRQNRKPWMVLVRASLLLELDLPNPLHQWDSSLRFVVDCQEMPVMFVGSDWLEKVSPTLWLKGVE